MQSSLKQALIENEVLTHKELARRKLDFEIIKDNYKNKATKEILDRFTLGQIKGSPGHSYRFEGMKKKVEEMKRAE